MLSIENLRMTYIYIYIYITEKIIDSQFTGLTNDQTDDVINI